MMNIIQEQWIKCDTNLNIGTKQCPTKKLFSNSFDYTQTMINTFVIFLTQYFQHEKMI
jgi:hypothetical protein